VPSWKISPPPLFAVNLMLPFTSSGLVGEVVPMPTLVLALAPFTPLMLPSTRLLLAETKAFAPMAVALVSVPVLKAALAPMAVLYPPVIELASNVTPAIVPNAVL
jgi:hypothetical protein